MVAHLLPTLRLAVFGATVVFSIIILGICAHLISFTNANLGDGVYLHFSALALATSLLSLLAIVPMIVIDLTRKGAFTSKIAVEIGVLSILWVLWLASAATATQSALGSFSRPCDEYIYQVADTGVCREFSVVQAFSYITWLMLMAYTILLLTFAVIAGSRGNNLWMSTVGTADLNAAATTGGVTTASQYGKEPATGYPPQQAVPAVQPQFAQNPTQQYAQQPYSPAPSRVYPQQTGSTLYPQNTGGQVYPQSTGGTGMPPPVTAQV